MKFLLPVTLLAVHGPLRDTDPETDGRYSLIDYASESEVLSSWDSYKEARAAWEAQKDKYDNLGIEQDGKVLAAEYAMVLIPSSPGCDLNTVFTTDDGKQGYVNGCYGKDAWYISTSDDGSKVVFAISGVKGTAASEKVEILPQEKITTELTSYTISGGTLYHRIRSDMETDSFTSVVALDDAFEPLQEDTVYYSSDGHYFYTDPRSLQDDLRAGTNKHSVNQEPWYCYYQFLSHRSLTSLTPTDLETVLTEKMAVTGALNRYVDTDGNSVCDIINRSQYYGTVPAFYQYQYQYGANALMMMAVSCNESGRGKSYLAYTRNNLFGHAAYDTAVEESASRYLSTQNSIYSHARYYLSRSYCNPVWENYRGAYFGNKASGLNVNYASDPYWGEKAAAFCRRIAAMSGKEDARRYTIGICRDGAVTVYRDPACTSVLYTAPVISDYAAVILADAGTSYRIQSDLTFGVDDEHYAYDYAGDIGYIPKQAVRTVIAGSDTAADSFVQVTFDPAGGVFRDGASVIRYSLPKGEEAACTDPVRDGMFFAGWDGDLSSVSADTVFHARYEKIASCEFVSLPPQEYIPGEALSLQGGILRITTEDGQEYESELTTSMISGYDAEKDGDQTISVRWSGASASYTVHSAAGQRSADSAVDLQRIYDVMYMADQKNLRSSETSVLIALKQDMDVQGIPALTMVQRMMLDKLLRRAINDRVAYVLRSDWKEAGVSGLAIAVPLDDGLSGNIFRRDVCQAEIRRGEDQPALVNAAAMLGYDAQFSADLTVTENGTQLPAYEPLVISLPKPDTSLQYTVLHMSADRDILECRTVETAGYVRFIAAENGNYLIAARPAADPETTADLTESLTVSNSSFLYWNLIAAGAAAVLILILAGAVLLRRKHS